MFMGVSDFEPLKNSKLFRQVSAHYVVEIHQYQKIDTKISKKHIEEAVVLGCKRILRNKKICVKHAKKRIDVLRHLCDSNTRSRRKWLPAFSKE